VFGKLVGGMDVLSKMEAVETDKKDRPKSSITIEDCIVFVDPYQEVDEQVKKYSFLNEIHLENLSFFFLKRLYL
jgi:hypothetical protein